MKSEFIKCRSNCGACCIVPSISSPLPGMPKGKIAGVRCTHLTDDLKCNIFHSPLRPKVCNGFKADLIVCGNNREEAIQNLMWMEGMVRY